MMARSLKGSINRPDTEAQDQPSPNHHFRLATRGRSIQMGQLQTWHVANPMFAFEAVKAIDVLRGIMYVLEK